MQQQGKRNDDEFHQKIQRVMEATPGNWYPDDLVEDNNKFQ